MIQSTQVLWLVRHGESTWNTLGLAQGHCDQARLTRLGQRQAWAVASQLRDRPVGALYASDLRRALETAAPLAEVTGLTVARDPRLRERCLGVLEGAATGAIGPAANGLRGDEVVEPDAHPEGGDSLRGIPVERMKWEPLSNGCIMRSPEGWPAVWPAPQHESR